MEDGLLRILDTSPQAGADRSYDLHGRHLKRIVRLPTLTSLKLDDNHEAVGYILALINTPALASLGIRSHTPNRDVAQSLNHFFPDDRPLRRFFSDLPVLRIGAHCHRRWRPSLEFNIGSFRVQFDSIVDDIDTSYDAARACVLLVPLLIATLNSSL